MLLILTSILGSGSIGHFVEFEFIKKQQTGILSNSFKTSAIQPQQTSIFSNNPFAILWNSNETTTIIINHNISNRLPKSQSQISVQFNNNRTKRNPNPKSQIGSQSDHNNINNNQASNENSCVPVYNQFKGRGKEQIKNEFFAFGAMYSCSPGLASHCLHFVRIGKEMARELGCIFW
ncbi:hypothetical protein Droror1_Dr00010552 [Drosera rotundifolia]